MKELSQMINASNIEERTIKSWVDVSLDVGDGKGEVLFNVLLEIKYEYTEPFFGDYYNPPYSEEINAYDFMILKIDPDLSRRFECIQFYKIYKKIETYDLDAVVSRSLDLDNFLEGLF